MARLAVPRVDSRVPSAAINRLYFEEVEALKATGVSNANAIRKVAKTHRKTEAVIRGRVTRYRAAHPGLKSVGERVHAAVERVEIAVDKLRNT